MANIGPILDRRLSKVKRQKSRDTNSPQSSITELFPGAPLAWEEKSKKSNDPDRLPNAQYVGQPVSTTRKDVHSTHATHCCIIFCP